MQLKDYDSFPDTLPMIVEDNMFLYPFMIAPLFIESDENQKAVQFAIDNNKLLVVSMSLDGEEDSKKGNKKFYNVAIAGNVMRKVALPDGKIKVLFQGLAKVIIQEVVSYDPLQAVIDNLIIEPYDHPEIVAILDILRNTISTLSKLNKQFPVDLIKTIEENNDPDRIADLISSVLQLSKEESYELLRESSVPKRLYHIIEFIKKEIESIKLKSEINKKVNKKIEKTNKDYFLKEQLKTIQKELGDNNKEEEIAEFRKQLDAIKPYMNKIAFKEVSKQIDKLSRMHPESGDASMLQTYIEQVLEIPFGQYSDEDINVQDVENQLNEDHYSLEEPKERISEYFAVKQHLIKRKIEESSTNSTVLCFVGPPGVGKT
ncbi:MAG: LON peptidase substrate-binding domain-containing protein, partial [Arcobacteraceae bacterium]|nr:LON peptidase substrate-binding domain-containing protein [Arcobacteraceae bacterium]